ncbi:MAG: glycosyltransferase [Rhodanobacteraceae bacterium]
MGGDLVSVIMPVYNAGRWLRQAIDSVRAQTHEHWELLAVDDGSCDESPEILADFAQRDRRIRVLTQANAGVAAARNRAMAEARGDYVALLDADDWWQPLKLERQLACLRRSGSSICYAPYQRVDEQGRVLGTVVPPARVTHRDMLDSNYIGNLTGMYARRIGDAVFRDIGHEDYVFWLEQVRRAGSATRVPGTEPLAAYRVREHSLSGNKLRAARWQWTIYRTVEHLGVLSAARHMLRYAWHALAKRRPGVTDESDES